MSILSPSFRVVYVQAEPYTLHTIYANDAIRARNGLAIFAEDDCGNWIAESEDSGEILFIDHETDARNVLARDFGALIASLTTLRDSDAVEPRVVSAWIDPEFMKTLKGGDPK